MQHTDFAERMSQRRTAADRETPVAPIAEFWAAHGVTVVTDDAGKLAPFREQISMRRHMRKQMEAIATMAKRERRQAHRPRPRTASRSRGAGRPAARRTRSAEPRASRDPDPAPHLSPNARETAQRVLDRAVRRMLAERKVARS